MLTDSRNQRIELGLEIGRGGEGKVCEVQGQPQLLAKMYAHSPAASRRDKLEYMCGARDAELTRIAAWPQSVLYRGKEVVGFLMSRVAGRPIHQLYRPVDRKQYYANVTWQGLVKVCQNLAHAFNALHSRSVLMADVNESNVFVTESGEVRFIDCDSFQVATPQGVTYTCDVGTPMWTPPELQGKDLGRCARNVQHDLFGLAAMIFHVLFMGRHPYAGVPKSADLLQNPRSLEDNIARGDFPFLRRGCVSLDVPPRSLILADLPDSLARLFEEAFTGKARPSAAEWYRQLGAMQFKACQFGHVFAKQIANCPWCRIWNGGGSNFFDGMAAMGPSANWASELAALVKAVDGAAFPRLSFDESGIYAIELPAWSCPAKSALVPPRMLGNAMIVSRTRPQYYAGWLIMALAVSIAWAAPHFIIVMGFLGWVGGMMVRPGLSNPAFEQEVRRRHACAAEAQQVAYNHLEVLAQAEAALRVQLASQKASAVSELKRKIEGMRAVWSERRRSLAVDAHALLRDCQAMPSVERSMFAERSQRVQREEFLRGYKIADHDIPQIGSARSATLARYGIDTALDVLKASFLPNIGRGAGTLRAWAQQIESQFRYYPNAPVSAAVRQELRRDMMKIEAEFARRVAAFKGVWQLFLRDQEVARLQVVVDDEYRKALSALLDTCEVASKKNRSLLDELQLRVHSWGRAVADVEAAV